MARVDRLAALPKRKAEFIEPMECAPGHQAARCAGMVLRRAALCDPVDQDGRLRYRRSHAVQQPQFEWHRYPREALRPVGLNLAILDLLGARDDLRQSFPFNGGRDPVVVELLHWIATRCPRSFLPVIRASASFS